MFLKCNRSTEVTILAFCGRSRNRTLISSSRRSSSSARALGPPRPMLVRTSRDSLLRPDRASWGPESPSSTLSSSHSASSSITREPASDESSIRRRLRPRSSRAFSLSLRFSSRFSRSSHLLTSSSRLRRRSWSTSQDGSSL